MEGLLRTEVCVGTGIAGGLYLQRTFILWKADAPHSRIRQSKDCNRSPKLS